MYETVQRLLVFHKLKLIGDFPILNVNNIQLKDFRNFDELTLTPRSVINVFIGKNAQGKTNLLEAIHFASLGRSQRVQKESDLIRWNQQQAIIRLIFNKLGVEQTAAFEVSADKPRRILVNEQPVKVRQLVGKFNTVLFAPEDLFLIKGSPVNRRKFLDAEISQASPVYFNNLLNYNRILTQRNSLLKLIKEGRAKTDSLSLWNEQLSEIAVKVIEKRLESIKKINELANGLQQKISSELEQLEIVYEMHGDEICSGENLNVWYKSKLDEMQMSDIARGSTSFGPHHDDIKFLINRRDLRSFGSQGQQRTAVLALKLSELEFLKIETGDYPVLLLDDVMSELDSNRRKQLLAFLNQQKIQTFITATDKAYFDVDSTADFFKVENGTVEGITRNQL